MSDIFREVEEDVRRERFQKLWKAYGDYAIAGMVLLFLGIGGYELWQRHEAQERDKASAAFVAAQRITNPQAAANAFADLGQSAPSGYGELSRLAQANAMFASAQTKNAIDLYKDIAKKDSGPVGAVARLRAAWGMAEYASRTELATLLAPLDDPGSAWREMAEEVLAYADYRALDLKAAQARYQALVTDPESPDALRARARAMTGFLKNGGAIAYGTVPPETVPPPAPAQGQ